MNWLNHTKSVNLDPNEVDLDDDTYLVPNYSELEPLIASIRKLGIINAPFVQERSHGRTRPLLGRRRLMACAALGIDSVKAYVAPSEMPVSHGYQLAFWDNFPHRTFDKACTAFVVKKLLDLFPREVVATEFLPLLGVPARGPRLEQMRAIGGLDHEILNAFAHGQINEKTAAILAESDDEGQKILFNLIQDLGMNANKNAQLIESLVDLSVFQEKSIRSFIARNEAREILQDLDIPRPQRADKFRELLQSWRTPNLAQREEQFRQWQRSLPEIPRVVIHHTEAFEDDKFKLEITALSREDVEKILATISNTLV